MQLYRSTITIYSEFDPALVELDELAREAVDGVAYCDSMEVKFINLDADDDDSEISDDACEFFSWTRRRA